MKSLDQGIAPEFLVISEKVQPNTLRLRTELRPNKTSPAISPVTIPA
jgi:hypothetical protein